MAVPFFGGLGQDIGGLINNAGYLVSDIAGHPVQLQPGGAGANLNNFSGGNVPTAYNVNPYQQPQQNTGIVNSGGQYVNPGSYGNGGSVLAAHTQPYGGGGGAAPATSVQQSPQQQGPQQSQQQTDPYAQLRNDISSGWDSYINSLNGQQNDLTSSRDTQNSTVNDQYNQGVNMANTAKASSLRDIGNTVRSAFQAGNNYLGARGAGDSSAGDMFNFATNQQAAKQTSDLNNFVNNQISGLASQRDSQLNQISQWFTGAQHTIQQAISSGALSKSQDLQSLSENMLNQAQQRVAQVQQNAMSQYNALTSWAANHASSLGQLQSQIASIPQPMSGIQMDSSGNPQVPIGYGGYSGNTTNTNQTQNPNLTNSGTGLTTAGLFQ